MSSEFNPWSRTEAEEWANSYMAERQITPEDEGSKLLFDSFLAGLAKAAEVIAKAAEVIAKAAEVIAKSPTKQIIVETLKNHTKEMEGYSYFGSNPGVSEDDYEEIADEIVAQLVGVRPIEKGKTDGE